MAGQSHCRPGVVQSGGWSSPLARQFRASVLGALRRQDSMNSSARFPMMPGEVDNDAGYTLARHRSLALPT